MWTDRLGPLVDRRQRDHVHGQVAEALAVERGVLCLPGSAFGPGQQQHLRLAFANTETDAIPQVADRLAGLCRAAW